MAVKVKATGMIAQLFRHTENFEALLMHGTLLQVRCAPCVLLCPPAAASIDGRGCCCRQPLHE